VALFAEPLRLTRDFNPIGTAGRAKIMPIRSSRKENVMWVNLKEFFGRTEAKSTKGVSFWILGWLLLDTPPELWTSEFK
jgi:hypothetical protein